jgi:hypothetical protein
MELVARVERGPAAPDGEGRPDVPVSTPVAVIRRAGRDRRCRNGAGADTARAGRAAHRRPRDTVPKAAGSEAGGPGRAGAPVVPSARNVRHRPRPRKLGPGAPVKGVATGAAYCGGAQGSTCMAFRDRDPRVACASRSRARRRRRCPRTPPAPHDPPRHCPHRHEHVPAKSAPPPAPDRPRRRTYA